MNGQADILSFWFGELEGGVPSSERLQFWFAAPDGTDALIAEKFGELFRQAVAGELDAWTEAPQGRLAAIILIDQFSRNIHRGSSEAFANDARSLAWCKEGVDRGHDKVLNLAERFFFYLPLEHSESLEDQNRSVACFQQLVDEHDGAARDYAEGGLKFAIEHRDIVAQFGRFPHRNRVLGRESTPDELAYLNDGGARFGQ
jgi:uncharacterized protein (DUF924 family)